jgi:hypothetical protein
MSLASTANSSALKLDVTIDIVDQLAISMRKKVGTVCAYQEFRVGLDKRS